MPDRQLWFYYLRPVPANNRLLWSSAHKAVVQQQALPLTILRCSALQYQHQPSGRCPYTPPVSTPAPTYNSGSTGTYTPSYAPVDVNAATHTVVRGDTVYNISKRYITQDNPACME